MMSQAGSFFRLTGYIKPTVACFYICPGSTARCRQHRELNKSHLSISPCLHLFAALRVFRQPDRGEASRGPAGPRRSFLAALRQPVVQSHLLVDEHIHHVSSQTPHRPQGHWKTPHRNESPHQLHETTQSLRGSEG